jgi:hypothetical protein
MQEDSYRPGQKVPESGVYKVCHELHRPQHEATLVAGDLFPECQQCETAVRFQLLRAARFINSDHDFRKKRRAHGA